MKVTDEQIARVRKIVAKMPNVEVPMPRRVVRLRNKL